MIDHVVTYLKKNYFAPRLEILQTVSQHDLGSKIAADKLSAEKSESQKSTKKFEKMCGNWVSSYHIQKLDILAHMGCYSRS